MSELALHKWILWCISSKAYERLDDLHLSDLNADFGLRPNWLSSCCEIYFQCQKMPPSLIRGYRLAIAVSLRSSNHATGVNFHSRDELASELGNTPPSLYVFVRNNEPWQQYPTYAESIDSHLFGDDLASAFCFHFEYRDLNESECRRSIWLSW